MSSFRPFLALLLLAVAAHAIPLIGRKEKTTRALPPSDEAIDVAETEFRLVASSSAGCANVIKHDQVGDVPRGESEDVEGIVTFGNITIDDAQCGSGQDDEIMKLFSNDVLDTYLPGGNILNLPEEEARAVFVGGADMTTRSCGDWTDETLQSYFFTKDIPRLMEILSLVVDNSTIPLEKIEPGRMWMVSAPQDGIGRVCLYEETSKPYVNPNATPEPSTDPEEDEDDGSAAEDDGEPDEPSIFDQANEAAIAEAEAEATADKKCFPGAALVRLEDGSVKTMAELELGDMVEVGPEAFSEVFLFTHRIERGDFLFYRFELESSDFVAMTPGHYLYVNGALAAAKTATVGDIVQLSNGSYSRIVAINKTTATGLYNPQTVHGDIIVDNVRASTYTTAVEPHAAHAMLFPVRALFSTFSISTSALDNGANLPFLPIGQASY